MRRGFQHGASFTVLARVLLDGGAESGEGSGLANERSETHTETEMKNSK